VAARAAPSKGRGSSAMACKAKVDTYRPPRSSGWWQAVGGGGRTVGGVWGASWMAANSL